MRRYDAYSTITNFLVLSGKRSLLMVQQGRNMLPVLSVFLCRIFLALRRYICDRKHNRDVSSQNGLTFTSLRGQERWKINTAHPGNKLPAPSIPVALCWQLDILLYDSLLNARISSSGTALKNIWQAILHSWVQRLLDVGRCALWIWNQYKERTLIFPRWR
jgi:hypothetical protein